MDVQKEIKIYNAIKGDLENAVKNGKVSSPEALLAWLREKLPDEQLQPDKDLGFRTAEDELSFLKRMKDEQPGLLSAIKRNVEKENVEQTTRLVNELVRKGKQTFPYQRSARSYRCSFDSFWDLIRYVKDQKMCTQIGCTTCGCMPFRGLIYGLGSSELTRLIISATEEEVESSDPEDWYEPFRLIAWFFSGILKQDCPLVRRYTALKAQCLAEIELRREESRKKQEEIHRLAVERKEANRKAHEERSREARERYYRSMRDNDKNEGEDVQ